MYIIMQYLMNLLSNLLHTMRLEHHATIAENACGIFFL